MMADGIELDGRPLWQWDTRRRVLVSADGAVQAHFARRGERRAVCVAVEDGAAAIPDELLQGARDVLCWLWDGHGTLCSLALPVSPRPRPDGYLYTPADVRTWEDIEGWVRDQLATAGVREAVAEPLPAGSAPTATLSGGTLTIGVPEGRRGSGVTVRRDEPVDAPADGNDIAINASTGDIYVWTD